MHGIATIRNHHTGFSLIECAITMTVLAVSCAIAVPSIRALIDSNRTSSAISRLVTSLADTRLTAVVRNQPLLLCPTADWSTCLDSNEWGRGWIAFVDADGNRQPDSPSDLTLVEQTPVPAGFHILTTNGRKQVRYSSNGTSTGSNVTFRICDTDGHLAGKVVVNNAGRIRTERPSSPQECP